MSTPSGSVRAAVYDGNLYLYRQGASGSQRILMPKYVSDWVASFDAGKKPEYEQ
jgi:hypothetical protein